MFVQLSRYISAPYIGRDHRRWHAKTHAVCIHLRWRNMIEEPSSFIIGKEERRTRPQGRSYKSVDYFGHTTLPRLNVKWWVLANQGFGNEKRYPRKLTRPQIAVVILFLVMEAGIVVPFFSKCKSIEPLEDIYITSRSPATIVAISGKICLIQQINDRWPIETAACDFIGCVSSTSNRPKSNTIVQC